MAKQIHSTREKVLRKFIEGNQAFFNNALDLSCHEGYFSLVLADYFKSVVGIDKNPVSIENVKLISKAMGRTNTEYNNSSFEHWQDRLGADFVLCFGLLYHVKNQIEVLKESSCCLPKGCLN